MEVTTGLEAATFPLTRCDGTVAPLAVEQLSLLARAASSPRPKASLESLGKKAGPELAPGVRRLDAHLAERLELAVDHFRKEGTTSRVLLISGYRPRSARSYHQLGRALDFRIEGVPNEALVAFCKTLPDTGCGYYPNSLFVHMDVRNRGTGHISWIDVSRPGEAPRYVTQWPLPRVDGSLALPPLPSAPPDDVDSAAIARPRHGHTYFF